MASIWDEVGNATNTTPQQIEREAALAWIGREVADTDREILTYVRQYRVTRPEQLEDAIREGTMDGHPVWEDVIDWTNLVGYREKLLLLQSSRTLESLS